MRLLLSIPAAMLGSVAGTALRAALEAAQERMDADPGAPAPEMSLNLTASPLSGIAGAVVGLLFGVRTAFWAGVALGAAGIERFDLRVFKMAGLDVEAMIERARSMAAQAQGGGGEPAPAAEFTVETAETSEAPSPETA